LPDGRTSATAIVIVADCNFVDGFAFDGDHACDFVADDVVTFEMGDGFGGAVCTNGLADRFVCDFFTFAMGDGFDRVVCATGVADRFVGVATDDVADISKGRARVLTPGARWKSKAPKHLRHMRNMCEQRDAHRPCVSG
jgi:hypothetical protein